MSENLNRREFVNRTAVGGVVAGTVLASGPSRAAKSPGNTVVVGIMGLSRGRALAAGFAKQPGVRVKYVCDVDKKRLGGGVTAVESAGGSTPQAIGDFRRILDDGEVDALVCAAPDHWHAPATILACAAGKHVYVEKPCCQNPREGELMVAAARKHRRAVQMGSQRRSGEKFREAMALLHKGVLGRVYCSRSWYAAGRGSIGTGKPAAVPVNLDYELWQGPAPRVPYMDNRIHYNWHWFWNWGTGELGNNGVHTLDLSRWGLDVDYPIRVTSSGGRYVFRDDQQTPDTHDVCFEFPGGKQITWQALSCNRHSSGFVDFYAEKGSLSLDSSGNYKIFDARNRPIKSVTKANRGDAEHIANLVAAIRGNKPESLNAEIEIGYKSTLLCHLGNIAHRTGRTLNCSAENGHILGDEKAMAYWKRDYEKGWEPRV